jgi:hypothetical protein
MEQHELSNEEFEAEVTTTCVVYDEIDGRIVHVHQFLGDGTGIFGPDGEKEQKEMALSMARQHTDPSRLRTLIAPADFQPEDGKLYRVDLKGTLIGREQRRPRPEDRPS